MELTSDARAELKAAVLIGDGRSLSSRAQMILGIADGMRVAEIADRTGTTRPTVYKWVARYQQRGIAGLDDFKSPGRPRVVTGEQRARIVELSRRPPPRFTGLTRWSSYEMAKYLKRYEEIEVSHDFVAGLWRENDIQPRRQGRFRISGESGPAARTVAIAGLYLDPPDGAVILSIDKNIQLKAVNRNQVQFSLALGKAETRAHDYMRHRTTILFTALEMLVGRASGTRTRPKTGEPPRSFLNFVDMIAEGYSRKQEIHVVIDNVSLHPRKNTDIVEWLKGHSNFTFHCMPMENLWINQVEDWFGIVVRQAIRRGSFSSFADLIVRIDDYIACWNEDSRPFEWTTASDSVVEKVAIIGQDYEELVTSGWK